MNKMVYFDKYCQTCKDKDIDESKDPCNECLSQPYNNDTHEPVCYKEQKK